MSGALRHRRAQGQPNPWVDFHTVADVPSAATKTPRPACFATSGLMRAQTGSTADSLRFRSRRSARRPLVYRLAKNRFRFRRWTPTAHPPAFESALRTADLTLYDGLNKRASATFADESYLLPKYTSD